MLVKYPYLDSNQGGHPSGEPPSADFVAGAALSEP